MIACPDRTKKASLARQCALLQAGPTECIHAHGELSKLHIHAHHTNPGGYDWKTVDVRSHEYQLAIALGLEVPDETMELQAHWKVGKSMDDVLLEMRPKLQTVFEDHGSAPPETFKEAVARAEGAKPNLVLGFGKRLYDHVAGVDVEENMVEQFLKNCPPVRALVYALLMRWYHRALRDPLTGEKYAAQCSDLFMAVHLPYCDKFVSAERKGAQAKCLREVAAVAGLQTEILSYEDFCSSFLVVV